MNLKTSGNRENDEKWAIFIQFLLFLNSLRLFRRENIVFCQTTIILIIIAQIFHKLLKKLGCGWGERLSVCDHFDIKEISVSNI